MKEYKPAPKPWPPTGQFIVTYTYVEKVWSITCSYREGVLFQFTAGSDWEPVDLEFLLTNEGITDVKYFTAE